MAEHPNFDSKTKRVFINGLIVGGLLMLGVFGIPTMLIQHQARQRYAVREQELQKASQELRNQQAELEKLFKEKMTVVIIPQQNDFTMEGFPIVDHGEGDLRGVNFHPISDEQLNRIMSSGASPNEDCIIKLTVLNEFNTAPLSDLTTALKKISVSADKGRKTIVYVRLDGY